MTGEHQWRWRFSPTPQKCSSYRHKWRLKNPLHLRRWYYINILCYSFANHFTLYNSALHSHNHPKVIDNKGYRNKRYRYKRKCLKRYQNTFYSRYLSWQYLLWYGQLLALALYLPINCSPALVLKYKL